MLIDMHWSDLNTQATLKSRTEKVALRLQVSHTHSLANSIHIYQSVVFTQLLYMYMYTCIISYHCRIINAKTIIFLIRVQCSNSIFLTKTSSAPLFWKNVLDMWIFCHTYAFICDRCHLISSTLWV